MPSRQVHDDLDSFLGAIKIVPDSEMSVELFPRQIVVNYDGHQVSFEFREGSHRGRVGDTAAFARALVGGVLIGLRAQEMHGTVHSTDPNMEEYLRTGNRWTSCPNNRAWFARCWIQINHQPP